jgi:RES domain-containing protein
MSMPRRHGGVAVKVWRISGDRRMALDGEETREEGGRWHRPGRPLVYTASSCALAVAEFLAHLDGDPGTLVALEIHVPDDLRQDCIDPSQLPSDWRTPRHEGCCRTGEDWLALAPEERGAVLLVPSAVVPLEQNTIIDPWHPDASRIAVCRVHDFELDDRLVRAESRAD